MWTARDSNSPQIPCKGFVLTLSAARLSFSQKSFQLICELADLLIASYLSPELQVSILLFREQALKLQQIIILI